MKKLLSLLLALLLTPSFFAPARAVSREEAAAAVSESAAYLLKTTPAPQVGTVGGEWAVIGLARGGCALPQSYWDGYYAAVEDYVSARGGVLHSRKYTEYSRVVLALTAIGANPRNVAGYDLLLPLGDFEKTVRQGVNGPIWALISLDSGGYDVPVNPGAAVQATRQLYVDELLSCQLEGGGWSLRGRDGGEADADVTGMALQALSAYRDQAGAAAAIDKALSRLSRMQNSRGGFSSCGVETAESAAQVAAALCSLGISLEDARFVKNGNSPLDRLMEFRSSDGGFRHTFSASASDQMASEQGLYALVAVQRALTGASGLYRMDDVSIRVSSAGAPGLPGKHPDVRPAPAAASGPAFSDIGGHKAQAAIEALALRGILSGYDREHFGPDDAMTRAQFAAAVVRALGLPLKTTDRFADVPPGSWYAPYVGSACAYGIVNGVSAAIFAPEGAITREQAAAMAARAAKLCGMDPELEPREISGILSRFGDSASIGAWARESTAFCCREGFLEQSGGNFQPDGPISRGEIAQMLYRLLDRADLL